MRVAFAGGGTGGHIYPAIAIEEALRADCAERGEPYEVSFFGNAQGLERDLVPPALNLVFVPSRALQRRLDAGVVLTLVENLRGLFVAERELMRYRPNVLIASGGYVCFPVVAAAWALRGLRLLDVAIGMLEPNVQAGLTNRLLRPLVDEVWGAYAESAAIFGRRFFQTGTPTRASLRRTIAPETARLSLGLNPAAKTIVVMGGSQGARSINEATTALVTRRALPPDWQILHVCGQRDFAYMQAEQRSLPTGNHVRLVPYLDDPAPAYAAADLVVARGGGSTLAELAVTATPALIIPFPRSAEGHQLRNAEAVAATGAARILLDRDLSGDALWWNLLEMLHPQRLAAMRRAARDAAPPDAAQAIVRRVAALRALRVNPRRLANGHAT